MAKAPSSFTRNQPRNHYSYTINQLYPRKSKINFIRNELKRIEDRCSTQTATTKHQNMFHDILRVNGHPENSIDQTKHLQSHQKDSQLLNTEWSYLKIPYISERLNHKITNIRGPFVLMTISAHPERLFVLWHSPIRLFYFIRFLFRVYILLFYISHRETLCTMTSRQVDNFIRFLFHIYTLLLYISFTFFPHSYAFHTFLLYFDI